MSKELKIIVKGSGPNQVIVFVDEKRISLIQEINFNASVGSENNQIEIVFPDLLSIPGYLDSYSDRGFGKEIKENIAILEEIPNVKITLKPI